MFNCFLNAWWMAVNISHNKQMEYYNDPTPEVVNAMTHWDQRVRRLQRWSAKRWGLSRVADAILKRQNETQND